MLAAINDTLARASDSDAHIIDIRDAAFDGVNTFRLVRAFPRHAKSYSQVRVIKNRNQFVPISEVRFKGQVAVLNHFNVAWPGNLHGVMWEERLLDADAVYEVEDPERFHLRQLDAGG